jgi:predicted RecA/RadA family phage recombinase
MSEASLHKDAESVTVLAPTGGLASGEVIQLADGRAGYVQGLRAIPAGEPAEIQVTRPAVVAKIANKCVLAGGKLWWDTANNYATPLRPARGFYIGTAVLDAAAADTTVVVELNKQPVYQIEFGKGIWDTVVVKTAGTPAATRDPAGSGVAFTFSATNEAQKLDALSRSSVAAADGPILEGRLAVYDIGDAAAIDINIGLAKETHASDADQIAESVFFHLDGAALDIKAESDDGTNEVAATDTEVNAVDDTYFEVWIDARNPADVQLYIDGVNVLPESTFKLEAATGPLKALFHMEKTADDTTADVRVESITVRSTDLAAAA